GQDLQEGLQSLHVGLEVRRELEQHRTELVAELRGPRPEQLHGVLRVGEPPDVSDVPAGLHGHDESMPGFLLPSAKRIVRRELVEGVVDLHRGEALGVELEPPPLRKILRIEPFLPAVVLPPTGPDPDGHDRSFSSANAPTPSATSRSRCQKKWSVFSRTSSSASGIRATSRRSSGSGLN